MMQLISEENIKISNSTFSVEDALKNNTNVSIKIEAAHAGVMNGNYLFYLPKALASGANSLNKDCATNESAPGSGLSIM